MSVCVSACNSLSDFLDKSDEYVYKMADNLLDAMTKGEHSKTLMEAQSVRNSTLSLKSSFYLGLKRFIWGQREH